MFRQIISVLILCIIISGNTFPQTSIKGWGNHTSMKEVKEVNISGSKIWAASTGGLFMFDVSNPAGTIRKFTTFDGLLNNELISSTVDNNGFVWCGGQDGSVSVYDPVNSVWKSITDIQTSGETSRRINDLFQYGNSMFISTEFSLIQFNISRFQFVEQPYIYLGTFQAKTPVLRTFVVNDTVWAGTVNGIAYANINTTLPIQTNWKNFTTQNSAMQNNRVNCIIYFDSKVIFGTDRGMVYYQNNTLQTYAPLYNGNPVMNPIINMSVNGSSLYFATYKDTNNIYKVDQGNINNAQLVNSGLPLNSLTITSNGDVYSGTQYKGVDILTPTASTSIIPDGQFSNLTFSTAVDANKNLWAVSGPLGNWFNESGIYKYDGTGWKNFTYDKYPELGTGCCGWTVVYPSKYDPNTVWVGSLGNGLLKITGDSLKRYTDVNSVLKYNGNSGFVIAFGLCEDNNGDLWVLNNYTTTPFVNFTKQQVYPAPIGSSDHYFFTNMVIDNYNTKWCILDNTEPSTPRGLFYYNESINSARLIDPATLGSNVTGVNGIILEKNGEVWIATNNGIVIIQDPYQVVANPGSLPNMAKMRIIENGLSTPLLENVFSLGVDALNNKWIGTFSNGVIYVSPDGSTLLKRFNTLNSPIADDKIMSIATDPGSGTAYFGTNRGISSYSTIAVQPLENCDQIKVGPSPFLIPNTSLLKIDGLVAESTVKILTISGSLVYEFKTEGGRIANWDGRDFNGNLVSSGIYIVAGYNKDATKVCTGKVAVVRK